MKKRNVARLVVARPWPGRAGWGRSRCRHQSSAPVLNFDNNQFRSCPDDWGGQDGGRSFLTHYVKSKARSSPSSPASVLHGERDGAVTKPLLMSHNYVNLQWAIFMQMLRANYSFMPGGMKKSIVFQGALFLSMMRLGTISWQAGGGTRWLSGLTLGVTGQISLCGGATPWLYHKLLSSSSESPAAGHRGRRNYGPPLLRTQGYERFYFLSLEWVGI